MFFRTDIDENNDRESVNYIPADANRSSISTKQPIDNPDQRIVQDADTLCRTLSIIIPLILLSPFTIGYYSYRTWQITGYYGPISIFLYFIVWSGINKLFTSPVARTIFRQNIYEGNFRFLHAQVRIYNEPIAFYDGGAFEYQRFDNYFLKSLRPILIRRNIQEFFLNLSMNLFDYIGSIISYLLLALAIFVFHIYDHLSYADLVQLISEGSFIIMYLSFRFNLLNDIMDKVTLIAANTHRVQAFVEYMKDIDITWAEKQSNEIVEQNEVLVIKNLTYSTPNNTKDILMKNLNLSLNHGQHMLITGFIIEIT
jgi:ATP-binding cassette subfamily D (ALD) protein 4